MVFASRLARLVAFGILITVLASFIAYSSFGTSEDAVSYQYKYRPLRMGTQIQIEVVRSDGTRIGVANCSLGFPAYYEVVDSGLGVATVCYGVVTASHCGYVGNRVYQNATGTDNYIGYMRDEGRLGLGEEVLNANMLSDSTFITVECYTYNVGNPRPRPQIVSGIIHASTSVVISGYISSEQDLWQAYQNQIVLYKSGRTTGLEAGRLMLCNGYNIACQNPTVNYSFLFNAYCWYGDSGGSVYRLIVYREVSYAIVFGITVGFSEYDCSRDALGVQLCRPTAAAILYNITADLKITPYSG